MKKVVLLIHYAEHNAHVFIRLPASTGGERSLFTVVGCTQAGGMHEYEAGSLCSSTRSQTPTVCTAQIFADKHETKVFTVILWCFPKISSSLSLERVHDRCPAKEAAPGRVNVNMKEVLNTRRWVCFLCFSVGVAALQQERGTCFPLQRLARRSSSYYACWQDWER